MSGLKSLKKGLRAYLKALEYLDKLLKFLKIEERIVKLEKKEIINKTIMKELLVVSLMELQKVCL